MQTQKVKVVRSFYFDRKPLAVGAIVDLPSIFAREVIASNKAVAASSEEHAAAPQPDSKRSQKALV